MKNTLREALKASATFDFEGDAEESVKLALMPGIYDTLDAQGLHTSADNLVNAGYAVDEVADDWSNKSPAKVKVEGLNRVRYRDLINTVNRCGIKVTKIVIQNKNTNSQDIFDQEIEVARTAVGARGAMDFIQLQDYVDVNAFDRTKITIDLSDEPLFLGPEVYMAMTIPAGARFSMKFAFEA